MAGGGVEREGETLLLADLVKKHSKDLPIRVRVDEGFCGSEERYVCSFVFIVCVQGSSLHVPSAVLLFRLETSTTSILSRMRRSFQ